MPGHLRRRSLALSTALTLGLLAGMLPQPTLAAAPSLSAAIVKDGLSIPWDVAFLPDGQMLVTERIGRVRVYAHGSPGAPLVRTIGIPNVWQVGEAGLMGIAVDVDYASTDSCMSARRVATAPPRQSTR